MFEKYCLVALLVIFALQENVVGSSRGGLDVSKRFYINYSEIVSQTYIKNKQKLYWNLVRDYNSEIRPYGKTTVTLDLSYICVRVDEKSHILNSRIWLSMSWVDGRLSWDPAAYGNVTDIRFSTRQIWTPDIKLYNSLENEAVEDTLAVVKHGGSVTLVKPVNYKSACHPSNEGDEGKNFCTLKFGSWTHNGAQIDLAIDNTGVDLTELYDCGYTFQSMPSANITTVVYECCPEPYQTFDVSFTVVPSRGDTHP